MSAENPNFTILLAGCNANCAFCTDKQNKPTSRQYIENLLKIVQEKPRYFSSVTVSGGEPTLNKHFPEVLKISRDFFDKVVLTTNGAKLVDSLGVVMQNVDHVNISRHGIGYEACTKIFGTPEIIADGDLKGVCDVLSRTGVDVNLNHVYTREQNLTKEYVLTYIDYAKWLGASSVTFRYDHCENTLKNTYLENIFSGYKLVARSNCPSCRTDTILVKGLPVNFKASFAEPSINEGKVFEVIYHPNGTLTKDWAGNLPHSFSRTELAKVIVPKTTRMSSTRMNYYGGSCGSTRC